MNSIEWLGQLVAFDTTSRNSNLTLINFLQDYLTQLGLTVRLTYNSEHNKANLLAILPSQTGNIHGGLILSGHTDVVPVDGQAWDTDPFVLTQTHDRVFGRGACDMKGFIAVILALLPELKALPRTKPLYLAFSYDEEVGCMGVHSLITDMQAAGMTPEACVVGEPTNMRPVIAHKGINIHRCTVKGHATHSSLTDSGCNAIEYAAQLMVQIHGIAQRMVVEGPYDKFFDVPYTTFSSNLARGGTAVNIVPNFCEFLFDMRNLPKINPQIYLNEIKEYINNVLLPKMHKINPETTIELESIGNAPGFETTEDETLTQLVRSITQDKTVNKVAYGTEAGLFQQAGIATIVCGPGNIEQAHSANEFLMLDQIPKCEDFLRRLVAEFLG